MIIINQNGKTIIWEYQVTPILHGGVKCISLINKNNENNLDWKFR